MAAVAGYRTAERSGHDQAHGTALVLPRALTTGWPARALTTGRPARPGGDGHDRAPHTAEQRRGWPRGRRLRARPQDMGPRPARPCPTCSHASAQAGSSTAAPTCAPAHMPSCRNTMPATKRTLALACQGSPCWPISAVLQTACTLAARSWSWAEQHAPAQPRRPPPRPRGRLAQGRCGRAAVAALRTLGDDAHRHDRR
jgi:hypothetical protein